jgi:DNA-binding IclR family transcriptional regulator
LVDRFQETVHLVIADGLDVVYIDKRESLQSMRIVSQVGLRLPAYCTGVGKAILAFIDEAELDRLLAGARLKSFTPHTITDKRMFKQHLQEVKRCGYALDNEEIIQGLRCVGAPIRDYSGKVVAALSVSGPSVRMGPARIEEIILATVQAAAEISHQLGYLEPLAVAGESY